MSSAHDWKDGGYKIATMTAQCKFEALIDTEKIKEFINKYNLTDLNQRKTDKSFRNQITLKIPITDIWLSRKEDNKVHNASLKIFNNGRLHITGCNSENMINTIISKGISYILLSNSIIKSISPEPTDKSQTPPTAVGPVDSKMCDGGTGARKYTLNKYEILMINTSFDVGKKLCLHKLWQDLMIKHNLCSTYDLKVYVGINSKFISSNGSRVTMLIFNSGKIILTGPRELNSINEAYNFIKSIV